MSGEREFRVRPGRIRSRKAQCARPFIAQALACAISRRGRLALRPLFFNGESPGERQDISRANALDQGADTWRLAVELERKKACRRRTPTMDLAKPLACRCQGGSSASTRRSIVSATPSATSASRIRRRLVVKCAASGSSTRAATSAACRAAAARSTCSASAASYSGIGSVQTRLSKSRGSRCPTGWRSLTRSSTISELRTVATKTASSSELAAVQYNFVSTITSSSSIQHALRA
ncbi:MAG: hypothetical protein F9K19_14765 [Rhizobiaceae bacterium]|nr:MAG: hypothetical protein F9K19_14765 [Rhizobiaceae bacterium]